MRRNVISLSNSSFSLEIVVESWIDALWPALLNELDEEIIARSPTSDRSARADMSSKDDVVQQQQQQQSTYEVDIDALVERLSGAKISSRDEKNKLAVGKNNYPDNLAAGPPPEPFLQLDVTSEVEIRCIIIGVDGVIILLYSIYLDMLKDPGISASEISPRQHRRIRGRRGCYPEVNRRPRSQESLSGYF